MGPPVPPLITCLVAMQVLCLSTTDPHFLAAHHVVSISLILLTSELLGTLLNTTVAWT
jgi:hypothetical protein